MPQHVATSEPQEISENILKLYNRLSYFETEEGRLKGLNYCPRPGDVFISTTPKAGTTWMQQICHQLRSLGDMTFDEVSSVVPWIELAADQGQDLESDQNFTPRCFKTHAWYEHCPKIPKTSSLAQEGGNKIETIDAISTVSSSTADEAKYIIVLRNPEDVAVSFFHFFQGWFFEEGEISIEEFVENLLLQRGIPKSMMQNASYWHHLLSWWEHKDDANVLIIFFEDLKLNLRGNIEKVAKFMGFSPETDIHWEKRIEIAYQNSSFAFMKAHGAQFDEHLSKQARNEAMGLSKNAGMANGKVREGNSTSKNVFLNENLRQKLQMKWNEIIFPATGFEDYQTLMESVSI